MRTFSILFALSLGAATPIFAQTPNPRAQVLAGEFNKFKNETRNKKGVSITKYKEVVSEAWVATLADYAGRYRSDDPNLQIEIAADGSARGSGRDDGRFELRGLRVAGGLLTGTKAYSD